MATARTLIPALTLALTAATTPGSAPTSDVLVSATEATVIATDLDAAPDAEHQPNVGETEIEILLDARIGRLDVFTDTSEQLEDVRWAVDRFTDAGLQLPAGQIHMHADRTACARPDGSLRNGYMGGGPDGFELHICTNRSILLHELAHLWDNHAMTDELREALLELRGLETWNHGTWNQAGGEHLASIIAWGLGGSRPTSISRIDDVSLATAYELVTGSQPPVLVAGGRELQDGKITRTVTPGRSMVASGGVAPARASSPEGM